MQYFNNYLLQMIFKKIIKPLNLQNNIILTSMTLYTYSAEIYNLCTMKHNTVCIVIVHVYLLISGA